MLNHADITRFDEPVPPPGESPWVVRPGRAAIALVPSDPHWPDDAVALVARLRSILGDLVLRIEHVGSTAVPGLVAKPIIDLDVVLADPADEATWLPALEDAGFVLTVREPWWQEHRMLRGGRRPDDVVSPTTGGPAVNVHVFGPHSAEPLRHVIFRDWLRANQADRELYGTAKLQAAQIVSEGATASTVMQYNAEKQLVVREIYGRAFRAAGLID